MAEAKKTQEKAETKVEDLYAVMDMQTYADAYDGINRTKPILAQTIVDLVQVGQRPEDIKSHYMRRFPTSFLQAQKIYEAARYVDFMGSDLV